MPYLFTSESVSEGHPDKVADQISDAVLDHFLAFDPNAKVACETLVTTGKVVLAGEITSSIEINPEEVAREVIRKIGYTKDAYKFSADSCDIISFLHAQSGDILQGVDRGSIEEQGAGDQGIMFGYAVNETQNYMPLTLELSHFFLSELAKIRKEENIMNYLRPDAKAQVTLLYDEKTHRPIKIDSIVLSTQHDPFSSENEMRETILNDFKSHLIPRANDYFNGIDIGNLFHENIQYHINPTGKFEIGGPHGDAGLTGRKIIVDTYGGRGAHGGGAFSGKDPSKVDRSAAYAARHIAKNMVAAGVAERMLVQVGYAIGVVEPTSIFVDTQGTSKVSVSDTEIAESINKLFDLRPGIIERDLKLRNPMYSETASYGHMGRTHLENKNKVFTNNGNKKEAVRDLFTWEALNRVDDIRREFKL